jgi:membrane protein implicated in regulation of membrane protease activity
VVALGVFSVVAALLVRKRLLVVQDAIECVRGKVRAGDTLWSAEGPDAAVGTSVMITGARGTVLVVESAPTISGRQ